MHGSGRSCPVCREDLSVLARKLSSALARHTSTTDDNTQRDEADDDHDSDGSDSGDSRRRGSEHESGTRAAGRDNAAGGHDDSPADA